MLSSWPKLRNNHIYQPEGRLRNAVCIWVAIESTKNLELYNCKKNTTDNGRQLSTKNLIVSAENYKHFIKIRNKAKMLSPLCCY